MSQGQKKCWFCKGKGKTGSYIKEDLDWGEVKVLGGTCIRCNGSGLYKDTPEGKKEVK